MGFFASNPFSGGGSGGGGTGDVTQIDLQRHANTIASTTQLGHVKIDGDTIKIMADGTIYSEKMEPVPGLEHFQYVLPTTQTNQKSWNIPLADLDVLTDLVLVSHNTTLLTNQMYNIVGTRLNITTEVPAAIDKNNVFVIIIRGGNASGGGTRPPIIEPVVTTKITKYNFVSTIDGQNIWPLPASNYAGDKESLLVYYNSTYLARYQWEPIANPDGTFSIEVMQDVLSVEAGQGYLDVVLFSNAPAGTEDMINGAIIRDGSISIDKLTSEVRNLITSGGNNNVVVATPESAGIVRPDGESIVVDNNGKISVNLENVRVSVGDLSTVVVASPFINGENIFKTDITIMPDDFLIVRFNDVPLETNDYAVLSNEDGHYIRINASVDAYDYVNSTITGFVLRGLNKI